jgi:hypothetical protein
VLWGETIKKKTTQKPYGPTPALPMREGVISNYGEIKKPPEKVAFIMIGFNSLKHIAPSL